MIDEVRRTVAKVHITVPLLTEEWERWGVINGAGGTVNAETTDLGAPGSDTAIQ